MAENPFFRYNVLGSNPVFTGEGQGLSQYFPSTDDPRATRASNIGRKVANIADVFGDLVVSPFRAGGAGVRDAGLGIYNFLSEPSSDILDFSNPEDVKSFIDKNAKNIVSYPKINPGRRNLSESDFELRAEEDEGLIDSDIQKRLDNLSKSLKNKTSKAKSDTTQDATESELTMADDETFGLGDTKTDAKADTGTSKGGLTPEEQLMKSGMDSYIAALGEDIEVGSLEDYKKEFEKATGIDASGKVDKSMALTALGLALMQNKAGKGFNVGNILSEVGKAGEKALPALEKAKSEARAGQLAAGKYALGQRQKDIATNQAKSQDIANKIFEINKMSIGQSYDMQKLNRKYIYDLALQKQQLDDEIRIAQMTPEEYGDKYMKSASTEKLFDDFDIKVQLADGNYKGPDKGKNLLLTDINVIAEEMKRREQGFNDIEKQFNKLSALIDKGVTVQDQLGSMVQGFKQSFGYGKGDLNPVAEAKYILETIQAQEAPLILGEAGKTISDADRERVKRIVGAIDLSKDGANADLLFRKLDEVYRLVVDRGRKNLDSAYGKLNQYGYKLGPYAQKEMDRQEADNIAG